MGWKKIVKVDDTNLQEIKRDMKAMMFRLEKVIAHPDYNYDNLIRGLEDMEQVRIVRRIIDEVENPDPESFDAIANVYNRIYGGAFRDYFNEITTTIRRYRERIATTRSMGFLERVAETFGVMLNEDPYTDGVNFEHKGLTFLLYTGGVRIKTNRPNQPMISICIVDEQELPIGDFYATLIGYIVSKPDALDVLQFGIELAQIMRAYNNYRWTEAAPFSRPIGIFTPFTAFETSNETFITFLLNLKNSDHSEAPNILQEIEGALYNSFGSTEGFFE